MDNKTAYLLNLGSKLKFVTREEFFAKRGECLTKDQVGVMHEKNTDKFKFIEFTNYVYNATPRINGYEVTCLDDRFTFESLKEMLDWLEKQRKDKLDQS